MAGQDVSANLGGMLSQIGGAFAGAGQMGQGLMRPITMAFRPQVDMTDPESLRKQAAFYGRVGDTEQSRLFGAQATTLEERNIAETERQRAAQLVENTRIGQTAVANIQQRMNEVLRDTTLSESQRDTQLASLQAAATNAASQYGLNPLTTSNLAVKTQSDYNSALLQQGQVRGALRAEQQLTKDLQGQAAIANITQAIDATLSDKTLTEETRRGRLAALQSAANNAANYFNLGASTTQDLVRQRSSGYNALVTQEENLETLRRQNERASGVTALESAQASGDATRIEAARVALESRGYGDLVRQYDAGIAEYEDKMREYDATIAETGPLTDAEIALAKELKVSDNELATWKITPKSGRAALRQRAQSEATKVRAATTVKALSYGIVKDAVPGVLRQLEREGSQWFDIFDKDVEDLAGDILDSEEALSDLAARAAAEGVTDVEGIRNLVLDEMRQRDSSIWQSLGLGTNAVDEFLGTETKTINGQRVTIKKKGS